MKDYVYQVRFKAKHRGDAITIARSMADMAPYECAVTLTEEVVEVRSVLVDFLGNVEPADEETGFEDDEGYMDIIIQGAQ